MIVVEGPDGAGKTTLIERLSTSLDIPVAPRVVTKDAEAMVDLQDWVVQNLALGWHRRIYDRHRLISEPIYGPILREKPEPGFSDPVWLNEALYRFYRSKPVIIYCIPPFETVWENVKDDWSNRVVSDISTIRAVWGAYFNKAITDHVLAPDAWIYDYTSPLAEQKVVLLQKYLNGEVIKKRGNNVH